MRLEAAGARDPRPRPRDGVRVRSRVFGWVAAALCLAIAGCSDGKRARDHHPLVIIGFDGLEWRIARPLLAAGEMPNLRSLVERGAAGRLYTRKPAKSPVIWTTVATGKRPQHHGILDFLSPDGVPYTSESRRGKALWNIASDYGLETLTVGWWVTWPAEEVRGVMVAPYSAAGQDLVNWKGNFWPDLEGQTYPPELIEELLPIAESVTRPEELARLRELYFGDVSADELYRDLSPEDAARRRAEIERLVGQTVWSVVADETYLRVANHLLDRDGLPDLTMLYFGATDVVAHRFWRFMEPEAFDYEVRADEVEMLGGVIPRFYRRADAILGEILSRVPESANVMVLSDHGFHAEFTDSPHPRGISGHHLDGPSGVFVAAGPDIRRGLGSRPVLDPRARMLDAGWVDDIHPVALHLLGIPIGRTIEDPTGGPLMKILREDMPEPTHVVDHDEGFRAPKLPRSAGEEVDLMFREWMDQIGYTSGDGGAHERVGPGAEPGGR